MERIETGVRQTGNGWKGFILVVHDYKPLYRLSVDIVRLSKSDAKLDAEILKADLLSN